MRVRVVEAESWLRNVRLRMPFRFGAARMTTAPVCHLRIVLEDAAGKRAWGVGADLLPPAWFDKRPGRTLAQDVADLLASVEIARAQVLAQGPDTPFALWRATLASILEAGLARDLPPLAGGFGAALFERAVMDGAARLLGTPAWDLVQANALGIDLAGLHPDLRDSTLAETLPKRPVETIWARHTIGLSDPLTNADLDAGRRLNDGLPQSLEQSIRSYGLAHFKIKIGGDAEADLERLGQIASVLEPLSAYYVTLDGNEQYCSWDELERLVNGLRSSPRLQRLAAAVAYVEQPIYREQALQDEGASARATLAAWRPLLIDESDATLESWPQAVRLGYRGVSFKACKGFYRGLRNLALAQLWSRQGRGEHFLSSEDLTALPLAPLHQNLALGAMLGLTSQERNGHHYTRGLAWLTSHEREHALSSHPDLYTADEGLARLRIEAGRLNIHSLFLPAGLALGSEPPWEAMVPAAEWKAESLAEQ